MNDRHPLGANDIQQAWLLGGRPKPDPQAQPPQQAASSQHLKQPRNKARLTAAILYLVSACFLGAITFVLAATWGKDGLSQMLAEGNLARPAVLYLLTAGGFFFAASSLLFSPLPIPRLLRISLLVCALLLMLAGIIYAAPAVIVSMAPFWFFLRFHQAITPPASPDPNPRASLLQARFGSSLARLYAKHQRSGLQV
ncbi:MAG: hypothetical protein GZ085_12300 [Sulfuriferula multivorans]|uniref:Uncharacterized protein n=1 Tax=Sulfuriferula multivorans TaxID=1559896 RepID=A0A7C9TB42_9PROT|nr:hypothetical protein [Sulfuriferula multivorans]